MTDVKTIRIAAALIEGGLGHMLLVRKAGTRWFMQAGGKIEERETCVDALCRELREEVGLSIAPGLARHLGRFQAIAANESDRIVDADLYHVRSNGRVTLAAEIEEAVWVDYETAKALPLAPLTRDVVLPLFLRSNAAE